MMYVLAIILHKLITHSQQNTLNKDVFKRRKSFSTHFIHLHKMLPYNSHLPTQDVNDRICYQAVGRAF